MAFVPLSGSMRQSTAANLFGGLGGKKESKAKATPAPAPTPAPKNKQDMTWGGRPDPTPECYVDEGRGFWGLKKKGQQFK
eukprot:CAMPEP_0174978868 /NCGR_PEP_ID=MMETSP0004_2-20121128/14451_1 /TAXON_ID=420556 /ORGANISM="Ochromonas sp., Strain CCMP1393" /LENGTH=79 /DNA_ID=CAMNT_0016230305 /DNA_START=111 /DNA_END=350 /DNA_ORIENTATION=+